MHVINDMVGLYVFGEFQLGNYDTPSMRNCEKQITDNDPCAIIGENTALENSSAVKLHRKAVKIALGHLVEFL